MNGRVLASGFVVAILISAGAGYLVGSNTITKGVVGGHSGSTTQVSCSISGETIGVVVQVLAIDYSSHSAVPVAGVSVSGQDVYYCNDNKQVSEINPSSTNSSGWVSLFDGGGGMYYLNIRYPDSKLVYNLSVPVQPVTLTYVSFNVSTGNVTTRFCAYNFHCSA